MGGEVTDRRYTTAELDAMEQQAVSQGMAPSAAKDAVDLMSGQVESGENFTGGFGASLKRTLLGLEQAKEYLIGDDAGRERVNAAIRTLEEHPALHTPMGKLGEAAGTAAQFMGPQGAGSALAKIAPKAVVKGIQTVTGKPGSVGRTALQSAAYEGAQPVSPSDAGTDEYLMDKAGHTAGSVAAGSVLGKVGKITTREGPVISPERTALSNEAERLGIRLTPAQRTGDPLLQQYEEGLASKGGSAKTVLEARKAQQAVLDKKAAEAIGSTGAAPNEVELAAAREKASKGYAPIASIPKMSWDTAYITDLDKLALKQAKRVGGSPDVSNLILRLKAGAGKLTGDDFLQELQTVRNMSFDAKKNGQSATARQLNDVSSIMEDFAERRVGVLAKKGLVAPDAMEQLKNARTQYAKIHAIEKATEPITGKVSANKYMTQEFKRNPASGGVSQSPTAQGLRDVGATARVLKQVQPYIGSSGTAERLAGQQMVDASTGPIKALMTSGPILKNYLAAKYYMAYGGKPGLLGEHLTPEQNMYVRRLIPDVTFAGKAGATD